MLGQERIEEKGQNMHKACTIETEKSHFLSHHSKDGGPIGACEYPKLIFYSYVTNYHTLKLFSVQKCLIISVKTYKHTLTIFIKQESFKNNNQQLRTKSSNFVSSES